MRKSVILLAAVALSVVTVPSIINQAQAAPAKHRHATRVVQQEREPAQAKNPLCDNGYNRGNMNWQEYYHCYRH
jgi:hypothetical protein